MAEIPDEPVPPVVGDIGVPKWVLEKYKTVGCGDNPWQQRARLLQSLWRERHGWSCGARPLSGGARVLGSMLEDSVGRQGGNFVTPAARNAAEDAVASKEAGAVIEEERLSTNLLSSQPLCFNLFADLHRTEKLAEVLASLLPRQDIDTIEEVKYEHSPGRGVAAYTGDRSAIDVAVTYRRRDGRRGLLGFEVKYHENLDSKETLDPAKVADLVDPDDSDGVKNLTRAPLVQFARDHLLVRAIGRVDSSQYPAGATWVLLYPGENTAVARAAAKYHVVTSASDMASITLEQFLAAAERLVPHGTWVHAVRARYLDQDQLTHLGVKQQVPRPAATTWWRGKESGQAPETEYWRRWQLAWMLHRRWYRQLGLEIKISYFDPNGTGGGDLYSLPLWSPGCRVRPRYFGRLSVGTVHVSDGLDEDFQGVDPSDVEPSVLDAPEPQDRAGIRNLELALGLQAEPGHELCDHTALDVDFPSAWTLALMLRTAPPQHMERYLYRHETGDPRFAELFEAQHVVPESRSRIRRWIGVLEVRSSDYDAIATLIDGGTPRHLPDEVIAAVSDDGITVHRFGVIDHGRLGTWVPLARIAAMTDPRNFEYYRSLPGDL